jgi:hypothetical protein
VGRDAAVLLEREDRRRKPDGTFVDEPIHVTLKFEKISFDERAEFLDILNYNEPAPEQSTATIHCEWSYSEARDKWTFRRWGGDRKNQGPCGGPGVFEVLLPPIAVAGIDLRQQEMVADVLTVGAHACVSASLFHVERCSGAETKTSGQQHAKPTTTLLVSAGHR